MAQFRFNIQNQLIFRACVLGRILFSGNFADYSISNELSGTNQIVSDP